jgi:hypothetical protein
VLGKELTYIADETAESYLWLMKDRNVTGVVAQTDSGLMLV